jgi:hypothetical protein
MFLQLTNIAKYSVIDDAKFASPSEGFLQKCMILPYRKTLLGDFSCRPFAAHFSHALADGFTKR